MCRGPPIHHAIAMGLSLSLSLCLSLFLCLSVSLSLSICLSLCVCVSLSLSLSMSLRLSLSLSVCLSVCLPLSLWGKETVGDPTLFNYFLPHPPPPTPQPAFLHFLLPPFTPPPHPTPPPPSSGWLVSEAFAQNGGLCLHAWDHEYGNTTSGHFAGVCKTNGLIVLQGPPDGS